MKLINIKELRQMDNFAAETYLLMIDGGDAIIDNIAHKLMDEYKERILSIYPGDKNVPNKYYIIRHPPYNSGMNFFSDHKEFHYRLYNESISTASTHKLSIPIKFIYDENAWIESISKAIASTMMDRGDISYTSTKLSYMFNVERQGHLHEL